MTKKRKKSGGGATIDYMLTYGDMVTLLLCFFAIMFNPIVTKDEIITAVSEYFSQVGWGASVMESRMAMTGERVETLPSVTRGRSFGEALRRAISLFTPEIRSNKVKVTQDERGVIISFASDVFFEPATATLNIEGSREILLNLVSLLTSPEVGGRKFRIEGHTDSAPIDPYGPWDSNWQLSTERALNVLYYLIDMGVAEERMQVAGFSSTMPISSDDTEEGRMYNRRVDIVIIDDAHL